MQNPTRGGQTPSGRQIDQGLRAGIQAFDLRAGLGPQQGVARQPRVVKGDLARAFCNADTRNHSNQMAGADQGRIAQRHRLLRRQAQGSLVAGCLGRDMHRATLRATVQRAGFWMALRGPQDRQNLMVAGQNEIALTQIFDRLQTGGRVDLGARGQTGHPHRMHRPGRGGHRRAAPLQDDAFAPGEIQHCIAIAMVTDHDIPGSDRRALRHCQI